MMPKIEITEERKDEAEAEIREKRKPVDYSTIEYPIEILVQKYLDGIDDDTNELFIPDYQREMAWSNDVQSKFIESVLLGLPIPYIFVADVSDEEEENDARLEIIDGTQRIRTLANFLTNKLELSNLKKLEKLNCFTFADLPISRQRRFKRATIRMIQLTEESDEEVRRDLFERINTGSVELNKMEKRRGIQPGKFLDLIEKLSRNEKFISLLSFPDADIRRRDPQEFVLRFFAFLNNYKNFPSKSKVHEFLDQYLIQRNEELNEYNSDELAIEIEKMNDTFLSMLEFVQKNNSDIFHVYVKTNKKYKPTTRIKFESIAVGIALALRENKELSPSSIELLNSEDFKKYTKGDASSSNNKVVRRIEYVRDQLLEKS
ncbi:MAG: DUF262 domain-containing protein [Symploca sp. SIO1C4]|uniref:DUF262 domain-containing protein n=1 Tax=Symploca sp. SIO1C4 TaxID=2607765 RepID=A0A6B3NDD7_9CYAN|nr:DUF262 domain-containing protein [Symploca sp. SIO1C4]